MSYRAEVAFVCVMGEHTMSRRLCHPQPPLGALLDRGVLLGSGWGEGY